VFAQQFVTAPASPSPAQEATPTLETTPDTSSAEAVVSDALLAAPLEHADVATEDARSIASQRDALLETAPTVGEEVAQPATESVAPSIDENAAPVEEPLVAAEAPATTPQAEATRPEPKREGPRPVTSVEEAIDGALHIIAERIAENPEFRKQ